MPGTSCGSPSPTPTWPPWNRALRNVVSPGRISTMCFRGSQAVNSIVLGFSVASKAVTYDSSGALDTHRPVLIVVHTPPDAGDFNAETVAEHRYQPSSGAVVEGRRP